MDQLAHHFKIALRMLAKRPGLNAGRLLTVTIVVTAVTAVFAANTTFLRPLPPHADRLGGHCCRRARNFSPRIAHRSGSIASGAHHAVRASGHLAVSATPATATRGAPAGRVRPAF